MARLDRLHSCAELRLGRGHHLGVSRCCGWRSGSTSHGPAAMRSTRRTPRIHPSSWWPVGSSASSAGWRTSARATAVRCCSRATHSSPSRRAESWPGGRACADRGHRGRAGLRVDRSFRAGLAATAAGRRSRGHRLRGRVRQRDELHLQRPPTHARSPARAGWLTNVASAKRELDAPRLTQTRGRRTPEPSRPDPSR